MTAATRNYSVAVLEGEGSNDYARYMRTDALLSLQRTPEEMVHRDELMFQTVHQSTELWLKHACFEVEGATERVVNGQYAAASRLLGRAVTGLSLVTGQLDMLRDLSPWDFQTIRTVLGHGSGLESPGWKSVPRVSAALGVAFSRLDVDLIALYRGDADVPLYRLAEAMVEWDEQVSIWRVRHFKIATRILGDHTVGTKGTPVEALIRPLTHKLFPRLWKARTELTRMGPMG
jgi:tryptophan 2,3-dioxygenase